MHQIALDLSTPCPSQLASKGHPKVIGCAMGEVLFQIGVPLDVLLKCGSATSAMMRFPQYIPLVKQFTNRPWDTNCKLDVSSVEIAYDTLVFQAQFLPTCDPCLIEEATRILERCKQSLVDAGRKINVEFVFDKPQTIHHCPLTTTEQRTEQPQPCTTH